eukprot:TRINITY_DN93893_c0_g1_i1.p1 TRINITY_DN93893_c0_g1~~TRINITY_DN93893_c0_g1_i1.p1  ORF type:complete len:319 (-),score=70.34 TRINITY_DN93893_c0_g1_i1:1-927(-)
MGIGSGAKEQTPDSCSKPPAGYRQACKSLLWGPDHTQDKETVLLRSFRKWKGPGGDGSIRIENLIEVMNVLMPGFEEQNAELIPGLLRKMDRDRSGSIDFEELAGFLLSPPYLKEFFDAMLTISSSRIAEMQKIGRQIHDGVISSASGKDFMRNTALMYDNMEKDQLTPLLQASFDAHDKDRSGVLEKDESILFFSHYAELHYGYAYQLARSHCISTAAHNADYASDESREGLEELLRQAEAWTRKAVDGFFADAVNRQKAAFDVLDVNKNYRLERTEVIRGLLPGSAENLAFLRAMGLEPAAAAQAT